MTDGFLNLCKAGGFTSHDVVAIVRRLLQTRRVGHAGTLDPAAEGVLPICVGRATRLVDRLADADKGYYGVVVLGVRTRTDDAEGEVVETSAVPPFDAAALDAALERFRGEIAQRPPQFSAVKVAGRRAYALARRGEEVKLQARVVTVHRLTLEWWRPPRLALSIACSKGTYIRSIARDLGEALGCGAHLERLVRLRVGPFVLAEAISLDQLGEAARAGCARRYLLPPDAALRDAPAAIVPAERAADMSHGRPWPMSGAAGAEGALTRVYASDGRLLGLALPDHDRRVWRPRLAMSQQASGDDGSQRG